MERIYIADTTLCGKNDSLTFKSRLEIARCLDNLGADVIEFPAIVNSNVDTLLIRTASSFVQRSVISVGCDRPENIGSAKSALKDTKNARLRIELPISVVGMEYGFHKKPDGMLEYIRACMENAHSDGFSVEFCALDATRAEPDFLDKVIDTAISAGADIITLCDDGSTMLPDDLAEFVKSAADGKAAAFALRCNNKYNTAACACMLCAKCGIARFKTALDSDNAAPLKELAFLIENTGHSYGFTSGIDNTRLLRTVSLLNKIIGKDDTSSRNTVILPSGETNDFTLNKNDDRATVINTAIRLGYDLSEEDKQKVWDEFVRVAEKKTVGEKELDAIIASVAMQVPATYSLVSYVINSGNIISTSAQITLVRDGNELRGISIGDGSVDAAFRAIETMIGHKYELDDFQIQSLTEGKEAIGSALVKLRFEGKLYSGNGISTDIIEASIRAYINALNKIEYEVGIK